MLVLTPQTAPHLAAGAVVGALELQVLALVFVQPPLNQTFVNPHLQFLLLCGDHSLYKQRGPHL